ncbi:hypothetical protein [Novosphingobium sp. PC22D]|uniref:hypothetical protein n=1 Tax=Novosphingobium sp. PC22D TaxID=1962403 RepID=UPI00143BE4A9|nr:hypothetical protein [Novosphingobium sp. PC22D]
MIKLLKSDITRLFALGFAGGAVLVFTVMSSEPIDTMAGGIVPVAEAAATR